MVAQGVDHLPSKCEALSVTKKKKERKKENGNKIGAESCHYNNK
jgi:hypothetical protein